MFSFFKKNDKEKEETPLEEESENKEIQQTQEEETKGFFTKALSKTFENIKAVVPQKKEKIAFDEIEELLIEADNGV